MMEDLGMGYYPDVDLRKARSEGYAAGLENQPRTKDLLTAELVAAWNEGYDAAQRAISKTEGCNAGVPGGGKAETEQAGNDDRRGHAEADVVVAHDGPARPKDGDSTRAEGGPGNGHGKVVDRHVAGKAAISNPVLRPQATPVIRACGIVAIVDVMNLLVRAFYAGDVSAINGVRSMFETLGSVMDRLSPEFMIFAFDDGHVERTRLYPDYKTGRAEKPPELVAQIKLAEQALSALGWPSIRVIGWEADDVIASLATQLQDIAVGTVTISSDKDLLQLHRVTQIYHPWKGGEFITAAKCQEKHGVHPSKIVDYLSLIGDDTDCVPGVKGIGPKTAVALVNEYGDLAGILAAAERGDVPGATGKKLREQAAVARLSQQLITLRTDLPVGFHWSDWPVREPRADWRKRLEALGLGIPANRLASRLPAEGVDRGDKPSHLDIEWCEVNELGVTVAEVETTIAACEMTETEAARYREAVASDKTRKATTLF